MSKREAVVKQLLTPVPKPEAKATRKPGIRPEEEAVQPKASAKPKMTAASPKPTAAAKPKPEATHGPKLARGGPGTAESSTPVRTAAPATRRFAWAPVDGATGYHIEFFKGSDRVLARETKKPVLDLGTTWRYQGKTVQLTPGTYHWYVWPVKKGGRATQAVVQSRLTVP